MTRQDIYRYYKTDKKPIAHYDYFVTNAIYHAAIILDIVQDVDGTFFVYRNESNGNVKNGTIHFAKVNEYNNSVTLIDLHKVKHHISLKNIIRFF